MRRRSQHLARCVIAWPINYRFPDQEMKLPAHMGSHQHGSVPATLLR